MEPETIQIVFLVKPAFRDSIQKLLARYPVALIEYSDVEVELGPNGLAWCERMRLIPASQSSVRLLRVSIIVEYAHQDGLDLEIRGLLDPFAMYSHSVAISIARR